MTVVGWLRGVVGCFGAQLAASSRIRLGSDAATRLSAALVIVAAWVVVVVWRSVDERAMAVCLHPVMPMASNPRNGFSARRQAVASIRSSVSCRAPLVARRLVRCLTYLLIAGPLVAGAQTPPWRTVSDKDGIRLEARRIAGERFDELRVSTSLKVSPDAVADYLLGKYLDAKNKNIRRTFIQRGPDMAIWSDVLSTSVTSDRCYSMRFDRQALADGAIRVKFASLDEAGAKTKAECIALRSRGEWTLTPSGAGTRLIYASLTDIGGNTPAFLVHGKLQSAAVSSVRKVVAGASGLALPRGLGD
jgi:hypothetical protein